MRHLGLDLGGTYVKWVVLEGRRGRSERPDEDAGAEGPEAVIGRLIAAGREAGAGRHGRDRRAGPLRRRPRRRRPSSSTSRATGTAVRSPVPSARRSGAPARLINDARAFALAEWTLGAARGCDTAAFFVVGTGVGGGIVVGGAPHEGREGRAGELGHFTIDPEGPLCNCGNHGCVEAFVRARTRGGGRRERRPLLGIGIGNAIVVLAPDRVVVGGGVAAAGEALLGPRASGGRAPRDGLRARRRRARRSSACSPARSERRYAGPRCASAPALRALKSSRIVSVAVAPTA